MRIETLPGRRYKLDIPCRGNGDQFGRAATARDEAMNTVLDEVTSENMDARHVRRRVEDWEKRLNGLFGLIGEWLPDGWEARRGAPLVMHEKLMREFGVDAKPIPTLELLGHAGEVVRFKPHALWIVGNNGRVDVSRNGHRHVIVDMAENFAEPDWQVASADRRCDRETVTGDWLRQLLR